MFPKCSFINSYIHPNPFWAFGKIFTAFTLQCIHICFQKLVLISESFSKISWKLFHFKSMLAFQPKDIFIVLVCFSFFLFFMRYFGTWTCVYFCEVFLLSKHTYIYFVKCFCYIHAYIYIYFVRYDYLLSLCLFYSNT